MLSLLDRGNRSGWSASLSWTCSSWFWYLCHWRIWRCRLFQQLSLL